MEIRHSQKETSVLGQLVLIQIPFILNEPHLKSLMFNSDSQIFGIGVSCPGTLVTDLHVSPPCPDTLLPPHLFLCVAEILLLFYIFCFPCSPDPLQPSFPRLPVMSALLCCAPQITLPFHPGSPSLCLSTDFNGFELRHLPSPISLLSLFLTIHDAVFFPNTQRHLGNCDNLLAVGVPAPHHILSFVAGCDASSQGFQ